MTDTGRRAGTSASRRKSLERARHRQEMLDAAESVFAVHGYHATTMEQIAAKSGFSVGSLYNFFTGKDALYGEILNGIVAGFLAEMERRVPAEMAPVEALHALVDLRLDYLERHRGFFRMVVGASAGVRLNPSGALPRKSKAHFDLYLNRLVGIFERGIRAGAFDPDPALYQALAFDGMVNALTLYASTEDLSRDAGRNAIVSRFVARRRASSAGPRRAGRIGRTNG